MKAGLSAQLMRFPFDELKNDAEALRRAIATSLLLSRKPIDPAVFVMPGGK